MHKEVSFHESIGAIVDHPQLKKVVDISEGLISLVMDDAKALMKIDRPICVEIVFDPFEDYGGQYDGLTFGKCDNIKLNVARVRNAIELVAVFMHELVHAKQYERGDLRTTGRAMYWKGQEVPLGILRLGQLMPELLPWEREAYGIMHKLAVDLLKKVGKERLESFAKLHVTLE